MSKLGLCLERELGPPGVKLLPQYSMDCRCSVVSIMCGDGGGDESNSQ